MLHLHFLSESSCKQFFSSEGMSIVVKLLAENQVYCKVMLSLDYDVQTYTYFNKTKRIYTRRSVCGVLMFYCQYIVSILLYHCH